MKNLLELAGRPNLLSHLLHKWLAPSCLPEHSMGQKQNKLYKRGNVCIMQQWSAFVQPLLWWKSNEYYTLWVCVCSCQYPASNAHAPHCHLCPALLYNIFPHYLINGTIFKKLLNIKCVFWFSLQCLSESFLILTWTGQVMIKNVYWPSCKVPIIHVRF